MPYQDPLTVVAPKTRWQLVQLICNTGQSGWSLAEGLWDKNEALALRWNGNDGPNETSGNPQSTGHPTWFIVPDELAANLRERGKKLKIFLEKIACHIEPFSPAESDRVFKVAIHTKDEELTELLDFYKATFPIPRLEGRLFRFIENSPEPYFVPSSDGDSCWNGRICDGKWEALVQSNGFPEERNPTTQPMLHDVLVASVANAIRAYADGTKS
ncbi:MAG: hypothetical protein PHS57_09795 [Alphaproteobacteria bacterium]|nr:hypothetical protein [Alphaproteobacteria bacterium]